MKIVSKKERNLLLLDIVFISILLIIEFIRGTSIIEDYNVLIQLVSSKTLLNKIIMLIITIILKFIFIIINNILLVIIYLAFRITRGKILKNNREFNKIENIEYYREKLPNLTPAEISLINDIELETSKDISATILYLYQKEYISFNNNKISVNNSRMEYLKDSEKIILELIEKDDFNDANIKKWKDICYNEAIQDGYIKETNITMFEEMKTINKKVSIAFKFWGITFLISLVLTAIYVLPGELQNLSNPDKENVAVSVDENLRKNKIFEEFDDDDLIMIQFYLKNPIYVLIIFIHLISILTLTALIIYRKTKEKLVSSIDTLKQKYMRTEEGNRLAEKISGLKNYIHEYSLLSEKEKESIVVWEDFLVYAVLLEENEKIIQDIYKYKNINPIVINTINLILSKIITNNI